MDIEQAKAPFEFITSHITKLVVENQLLLAPNDNELDKGFNLDYSILKAKNAPDCRMAAIPLIISIAVTDKNNNKWLNFEICIEGIFKSPLSITEDNFIALLELNGLTALYGVARAQIATLSSTITDIEKINLPMVNIKKLVELKHNSEKENNQK